MKIIIDLDGVLIITPPWKSDELLEDGYSVFNQNAIDNLKQILSDDTELWLISSRRKKKSLQEMQEIFRWRGLSLHGLVPDYGELKRCQELKLFIEENKINNFLIIDDDASLEGSTYKHRWVRTSSLIGLSEEKLNECKEKIKMKYLIGIQPTGRIHIGNYLGCLKKGLELQEQGHDVTFLIANYHSLTTDSYTDQTRKELERLGCKNIKQQTPEYTELFFKMCCKVSLPTLQKMPQYKDKKEEVQYDMGLLLYPVLMAADIMINDPDVVIVGKDQVAHIELANDIAKRVGGRDDYAYEFGHVDKVMSLLDPDKKMSKSAGEKHVLYLFDEDYMAKLKKANMNESGLENVKTIARELGLQCENFSLNLQLKEALAKKMEELFKKNETY